MEEDMGKGLQMKDQDEIIGKNGIFTKLRRRTTNDGAHASSEDEQFEDAPQSPKLSAVSTEPRNKEELENFDKLNNTFGERINQLNVNMSNEGTKFSNGLIVWDFGNSFGNCICRNISAPNYSSNISGKPRRL
ncbi:hypothetical protein C1646_667045 [Rhizophagus diaphanus]|nr:hypothetical protein C1646_667045 [Rhizophagus diaphanus] [Rhizophagus sp. MUCL 43196]